MKGIMSSLLRAACSLAAGMLLILYPDSMVLWLTVAIGVLFFISGVISCLTYFSLRHKSAASAAVPGDMADGKVGRPVFPIVGAGSLIFGLLLALTPSVFVKWQMYILSIVLILGSINQYLTLINANKAVRIPFALWICPTLILLTGLIVLLKPMASAALPLLIIGWCCLLYGVTEIVNTLKIRRAMKRFGESKMVEIE